MCPQEFSSTVASIRDERVHSSDGAYQAGIVADSRVAQRAPVALVAWLVIGVCHKSDAAMAQANKVGHCGMDTAKVIDLNPWDAGLRDVGVDEHRGYAGMHGSADISGGSHHHDAVTASPEKEVDVERLLSRVVVRATRDDTVPLTPGGSLECLQQLAVVRIRQGGNEHAQ